VYKDSQFVGGTAAPADPEARYGPRLWGWDSNGIVLVQKESVQTHPFPFPISRIVFSPSGKFCLVQATANYYFFKADLTEMILQYSFDDIIPDWLLWCGSDTILLVARTQLAMIGASNAVISWTMDSQIAAITETDGVRIISHSGVRLLRAISDASLQFALWNMKSVAVKLFTQMLDMSYLAVRDPVKDYTLDELQEALEGGLMDASLFYTSYAQRCALMRAITRITIQLDKPKDDGSPESNLLILLRDFNQFAERLSSLRCS
jgi:hypothetical protein